MDFTNQVNQEHSDLQNLCQELFKEDFDSATPFTKSVVERALQLRIKEGGKGKLESHLS